MSAAERRDTFEATARVLDEHPELVDELYSVMRGHRPTLDRFVENASKDLVERPRAELAVRHAVANPEALEQVLMASLDAIAQDGAARAAMNRAIASRAEKAADIVTDSDVALGRMLEASLPCPSESPRRAALRCSRSEGTASAWSRS
jgi:hypothetical protein